VFIVALGFLLLQYRGNFSLLHTRVSRVPLRPHRQSSTHHRKRRSFSQSLQQSSSTGAAAQGASTTAAEHSQLLQQASVQPTQSGQSSNSAPQMSAAEKMKLLHQPSTDGMSVHAKRHAKHRLILVACVSALLALEFSPFFSSIRRKPFLILPASHRLRVEHTIAGYR